MELPATLSINYTSQVQKYLRTILPPDAYMAALPKAFELCEQMYPSPKQPVSKRMVKKVDEPVPPRPQITEHAERSFTFSWGEVKRSCPVEGCNYGLPYQNTYVHKHSDGSRDLALLSGLDLELVETEETEVEDVPELDTFGFGVVPTIIQNEDDEPIYIDELHEEREESDHEADDPDTNDEEAEEGELVATKSNQIGGHGAV